MRGKQFLEGRFLCSAKDEMDEGEMRREQQNEYYRTRYDNRR